jgi:hypothetical protein
VRIVLGVGLIICAVVWWLLRDEQLGEWFILLLEIGIKLVGLVVAIVIALFVYHALTGH